MTDAQTGIFGLPSEMPVRTAHQFVDELSAVLLVQVKAADVSITSPAQLKSEDLNEQLERFRVWFDPTAKGERLRNELARLEPVETRYVESGILLLPVGGERALLTPEGYLAVWMWSRALRSPHGSMVAPDPEDAATAQWTLIDLYRAWTRRRLSDVVGLLTSETSTLRPAAAGLLLTLLINRNTSPERALRRPREPHQLERVADAVAHPALTYASELGGKKTARSALDLYRGWALGELRRRLGSGFHSEFDEGIWLDEEAEAQALQRLVDDVRRRDARGRERVAPAISAALEAYDQHRPQLAALNLAFERPANTNRIRAALEAAAEEDEGARA